MKYLKFGLVSLVFAGTSILTAVPPALAAFKSNNIIDDTIFDNTSSMGAAGIDAWLNSNFGSSSCISTAHGFSAPDPVGYNPSQGFLYGSFVSGGRVVYDAAQAYGINPQVLLATLQKEESLVSGNAGCSTLRYSAALGYGCPDGGTTYNYSGVNLYAINGVPVTSINGTCVNGAAKVGFSQQLIHAAWLLKFGEQRSEGNTSFNIQKPGWDNSDDPQTCYSGPMTQGYRKRCSTDVNPVFYDGYITIDGVSTHMDDGATAALYWYTPHFSGNQSFYNIYSGWFGDPNTPCEGVGNVTGAASGPAIISLKYAGLSRLSLVQQNNTGTTCMETHVDATGFQSWLAHIATGMRATDPSSGMIVPSQSAVDHQPSLNYIVYNGASGHVEIHRLSPDLKTFPGYYDVPTDLNGITPATGTFVSGDFLGRGYDQMAYIAYNGAAGHVEVHLFDPTMQHAIGFYDIVTDLSGITASTGTFVSGDFLGRGYDQLAFVLYNGASGHVELHVFDQSLRHAIGFDDRVTDLVGTTSTSATFVSGDFLGRGYDQLLYVIYQGTNGRVETHMFNPSLSRAIGFQDSITNIAGFDPTQ